MAMTAIEWPALQPTTSAALALVLRHGPLGRAEMARQLGVSRANLTRVTRELLAAGLVAGGTSELRGETGRPSELLRLVPDAYHFAGVKLTADRLYAVVVDLAGTTVAYRDMSLRCRDVDTVLDQLADVLTDPDWQGYRI